MTKLSETFKHLLDEYPYNLLREVLEDDNQPFQVYLPGFIDCINNQRYFSDEERNLIDVKYNNNLQSESIIKSMNYYLYIKYNAGIISKSECEKSLYTQEKVENITKGIIEKLRKREMINKYIGCSLSNIGKKNEEMRTQYTIHAKEINLLNAKISKLINLLNDEETKRVIDNYDKPISITDEWINMRIYEALKNNGIETYGEFALIKKSELRKIYGIGRSSINKIENVIHELGIEFKSTKR